ncbi:MAG: tRNA (adenosine(37)-N6)-threonylcarbamoyltransferase complex transferase subunit TsaD [Candidatus Pacebacteria bacterium]|nr:tRNA (adenosine(37)-N6)-threonylcarbamoyltransferase complex transferase subunit TsaD [Candidatus Paceibacterota bacterium]
MKILGIETSCDETAVTLIDASGTFGDNFKFDILGNALFSQASLHAQYGGVFPNLAKREHAKNLIPLLREVLRQSGELEQGKADLSVIARDLKEILHREPELLEAITGFALDSGRPNIDAIAVTVGPGLEPALWVGINCARALAKLWDVPVVAVDHMEGHILLSMMDLGLQRHVDFPLLSLLISGGHTELVLSRSFGTYERIGETRDDAAGEAFDKVARLLDLPYPGGPEVSRLAAEAREQNLSTHIAFTRPMLRDPSFDFSFSGLKTAVRTVVEQRRPLTDELKRIIAREFEDTVADVLVHKTMRAVDEFGAQTVVVGGGVSANTHIRAHLTEALAQAGHPANLLIPPPELATDNAIMIAIAGYFKAQRKEFSAPDSLVAIGNLKLK